MSRTLYRLTLSNGSKTTVIINDINQETMRTMGASQVMTITYLNGQQNMIRRRDIADFKAYDMNELIILADKKDLVTIDNFPKSAIIFPEESRPDMTIINSGDMELIQKQYSYDNILLMLARTMVIVIQYEEALAAMQEQNEEVSKPTTVAPAKGKKQPNRRIGSPEDYGLLKDFDDQSSPYYYKQSSDKMVFKTLDTPALDKQPIVSEFDQLVAQQDEPIELSFISSGSNFIISGDTQTVAITEDLPGAEETAASV